MKLLSARESRRVLKILAGLYPNPKSELNFKNRYQLLVAVILSAQCTDKKVNEVSPALFKKYSSCDRLAHAKLIELEEIIRPVNYYKTKAKHLIKLAQKLLLEHKGQVPLKHQDLLSLPGVGNKTANVILAESGQAALAVDTHVFRVSHRLGLSSGRDVLTTELELKQQVPKTDWSKLHHWLIFHGRRVCKAQRPSCSQCPLTTLCPRNSLKTL